MAQIAEDRRVMAERAGLLLRQRPRIALVLALALGSVLGAAAFGIVTAQGSLGTTDGLEIVRDGEEAAGAAEAGTAKKAGEKDSSPDARDSEGAKGAKKDNATLVVDVSGAVAAPAVVELKAGARVRDAIEAAGGLAEDADISALNRAAACEDGQKVYVPRKGETLPAGGEAPSQPSSQGRQSSLVNINTADETALDALPGVGPSTARTIVEDRDANGPFSSVEDLMRVSGIGEKKFEKLKSSICV